VSPSAELVALALTLAYDHACSVIESNCVPVSEEAEEPGWFELPAEPVAEITDAVRLLEMRGLIEMRVVRRLGSKHAWVRCSDESEATA